ncbi:MAG: hypothetical protein E6Q37_03635 [Crocinitomicaceae bacterium]|nr:MAG: hypothetical protein E6Q37_03635 [Crocinitomicaceae bacterium]
MKTFIYAAFALSLLAAACETTKLDPNDMIIHHTKVDSVAIAHFEEIRRTPAFTGWKFNQFGPDKSRIVGFSFPEYISYSIGGKKYTDIGLYVQVHKSVYSSYIPQPKFICAFRSDTEQKTLEIYDPTAKKWLNFFAAGGKIFFTRCLNE